MAIKGADLLHVGNKVLIERAQTAGPGTVNINQEKIYELGNYYSVGQVRDTPDLTFTLESLDVSAAVETMLVGTDFTAMPAGSYIELAKAVPMDVMSEFKPGFNAAAPYNVVGAISLPYLVLESVGYRFGITDNAAQTVTLRGDSIFYLPGTGYVMEAPGPLAAGDTVVLAAQPSDGGDGTATVYPYNGDTVKGTAFALSVSTSAGMRYVKGADYTEAATGTAADGSRTVTLTMVTPVPAGQRLRISFASPRPATYPQDATHTKASAVRPAAIKGRNIEVFVGGRAVTNRWSSVQSVTVDYKVNLEKDEEFGNSQVVSQDFEVPDVTGSIDIKPRDYLELVKRVRQIAGIATDTEVAGPITSQPMPVDIVLHSPDPVDAYGQTDPNTSAPSNALKTLHIPDARFTLPGYSGRVQQKLTVTFPFSSDTGVLRVYKGLHIS